MIDQQYAQYTAADQAVWTILYQRQLTAVQSFAYDHFATGLQTLGLNSDSIPLFDDINQNLLQRTGWKIYPVPGLIPNRQFFMLMVNRHFGATTWLRKKEQLDYLEEPDMFHDTFGHIPLLADPRIADFLHELAVIAERYLDQEEVIEQIARLYWYTIEFGLVHENNQCKIYGAGILSSIAETRYSLSSAAHRIPFDLHQILAAPYIKDRFQEQYFVLDSIDQLAKAAADLEQLLRDQFG